MQKTERALRSHINLSMPSVFLDMYGRTPNHMLKIAAEVCGVWHTHDSRCGHSEMGHHTLVYYFVTKTLPGAHSRACLLPYAISPGPVA